MSSTQSQSEHQTREDFTGDTWLEAVTQPISAISDNYLCHCLMVSATKILKATVEALSSEAVRYNMDTLGRRGRIVTAALDVI